MACLVSLLSGGGSSDEDYDRLVTAGDRLRIEAEERRMPCTWILVVDPEHRRPNDAQRRRLVAGRERYTGKCPIGIALVTESLLIRGVMNAMAHLSPAKPNHSARALRSFDEALLWCEQERAQILPPLRGLLAKARAAAGAGVSASRFG